METECEGTPCRFQGAAITALDECIHWRRASLWKAANLQLLESQIPCSGRSQCAQPARANHAQRLEHISASVVVWAVTNLHKFLSCLKSWQENRLQSQMGKIHHASSPSVALTQLSCSCTQRKLLSRAHMQTPFLCTRAALRHKALKGLCHSQN